MQLLDWDIDPEFPNQEGIISRPRGYTIYPIAPGKWRAIYCEAKKDSGYAATRPIGTFGSQKEAVYNCDKHFKNNPQIRMRLTSP